MTVSLGMPAPPAVQRRKSRSLMVGGVPVGGEAAVSVQSMTTTRTADTEATLRQIAAGCQIVRTVPESENVEALLGAQPRLVDSERLRGTG